MEDHHVSSEPAADVALVRVGSLPSGVTAAPLGNSDTVHVGNQVSIVGAPYGLGRSLSVGWISARYPPNTVYHAMPLAEFLQTTAPINQGNSGGPMFDLRPGDALPVKILRAGKVLEVTARVP
jgi:serine protease Do